jgi:hypothetical protein
VIEIPFDRADILREVDFFQHVPKAKPVCIGVFFGKIGIQVKA